MTCMWIGDVKCIYFKLNYVLSRFYCPIKRLFIPEADDALTGGESREIGGNGDGLVNRTALSKPDNLNFIPSAHMVEGYDTL